MWSSDYPHTDSPWPRSKEYIAEHFAPAPEDVIAKVGGGNAAELYGIQTVFKRYSIGKRIGNAVLTSIVGLWHGSVHRLSERSIFSIN